MLPLRSQFKFCVLHVLLSHRRYAAILGFHFAPVLRHLHGSAVGLVCLPNSVLEDRGEESQREKEQSDYIVSSRTHPSCRGFIFQN